MEKLWEITSSYVNVQMPMCYTTGNVKSDAHFCSSGKLSEKKISEYSTIDVI